MRDYKPPIRDSRDSRPSNYQKSSIATALILGIIALVMAFMVWKIGAGVYGLLHPDLAMGIPMDN